MLDRFFNFQKNPFNLTPDPQFFYANPMYREAYDKLRWILRERKGYMALTGETGAGKTTLLKTLMNNLDADYRCVYFEYSNLTFNDFLGLACGKLGLETKRERCGDDLKRFLVEQSQMGITVAFIIDEAQNMPVASLAEILSYTNGLSEDENLVQIVLSGQPQLETQLELPELFPLRQRLSLHYQLSPLPREEVGSFIRHRLKVAGNMDSDIMTNGAIQQVTEHAQGRPRLINMLCSRALITAYATSQKRVSAEVMEDTIQDMREEQEDPISILQKAPKPAEIRTAEPVYDGSSDAGSRHAVRVVLPWKEEGRQQQQRFKMSLSKGIKTSHKALHQGMKKLSGLISEQPIGIGKGAAITALIWLLIFPVLEQKADDVEPVGTGNRATQTTVVKSEEHVPFNVPPTVPERPFEPPAAKTARTFYASNQHGSVELVETTVVEVSSTQTTDTAVESQQDLSLLEKAPTQPTGDPSTEVAVTADAEVRRQELEKKLLASEKRLAQVEAELARTREELDKANATIQGHEAQIELYVGQIERLHNTTDEPKYEMISFPEHLAAQNTTNNEPPEPMEQPILQDQVKSNIEPQKTAAPVSPIDQLLARADELMQARHLTTPAGNNALEIFRQVLKIDPNNEAGLNGIEQIKQQYLTWGARAQKKRDWLNAGNYYKKILAIDPSNPTAEAGLREALEYATRSDEKTGTEAVTKSREQEDARQRLAQMGIAATPKALLINAEQGNIEAVRSLLAAGVPPDTKLQGGWTALMSAATHGQIGVVRTLLTQGANVNIKNDDGKTALSAAAWNGHTDVVKELLASGAEVNEQNDEGWTALMYAAWNGHQPVVEALLEGDAKIGIKDKNDWTALTAASSEGHSEIVKILELAGGS